VLTRKPAPGATPLGILARGAIAGAVGTAATDLVWYVRYRRGGGQQGIVAWELGEDVRKWDDVSAPGQVGKRLLEGFVERELPDSAARPSASRESGRSLTRGGRVMVS